MSDGAKTPPESGVEPTFRKVFDEHARFIWRSLLGLGVAEADVPDASQQVFVVLHDRLGDLAEGCPLRTFVYGICLRVASDFRRRAHRRRERLCAEPPERTTETTPEGRAARSGGPRRRWRPRSTGCRQPQREVFVLYEIEELPMGEIARALGCPLQTAYSRLRVARSTVIEMLGRAPEWNGGFEVKNAERPRAPSFRRDAGLPARARPDGGARPRADGCRAERPRRQPLWRRYAAGRFSSAPRERAPGRARQLGSTGWRALGLTKAATALVVASAVVGGTAVGWHRAHADPARAPGPLSVGRGTEGRAHDLVPLAPAAPGRPIPMPPSPSERRHPSTVAVTTRTRGRSRRADRAARVPG